MGGQAELSSLPISLKLFRLVPTVAASMGGGSMPPVPSYKAYPHSEIEKIPRMMETREKLAKVGLKDPWARNDIWRYVRPESTGSRIMPSVGRMGWISIMTGFAPALLAVGVTIALDYKFHFVKAYWRT